MRNNKMVRQLIGLAIFLGGIGIGLWLGVWVMFIGGITQLIKSCQVNPIDALGVSVGLTKFFFSGVVGWVSGVIICGIGLATIQD